MQTVPAPRPTKQLIDLTTLACAASERMLADSETVRLETERLVAEAKTLLHRAHVIRDARRLAA
jgi:hypothetical protein